MDRVILYDILRPLIVFITKVFLRPKYIGKEFIKDEGRIILAGTHTHILDCFVLITATKRKIHFLAKKELWNGPKKILFGNLGLIPVNRKEKDPNALLEAIKYLENDLVIGIFPEGTTEKGRGLLPFKIGAVKMAKDADSMIIPFVIKGKYRIFSNDLRIIFGNPIKVTKEDLTQENDKLRNTIINMMEVN